MFHRILAVVGPWPLLEALLPPDQGLGAAILEGITDQQVERPDPQELARLVDQGHSNLEIGRRYGVHAGVVGQWRQAAGLPPAIPRRRPSREELADLVAQGLSDETIGHRYGRSAATVAKWRQADSLRRPRGRPSAEELARLIDQGLSDLQIGQRYGVVSGTVKLWRYEARLLRYQPSTRPSPQTLAQLVAEGAHRPGDRPALRQVAPDRCPLAPCRRAGAAAPDGGRGRGGGAGAARSGPAHPGCRCRARLHALAGVSGVPNGQDHEPTGHTTTWQRRSRFDRGWFGRSARSSVTEPQRGAPPIIRFPHVHQCVHQCASPTDPEAQGNNAWRLRDHAATPPATGTV